MGISVNYKHQHRWQCLLFLSFWLFGHAVFAQAVKSVTVQGNKKIESDAIVEKITLKVGEPVVLSKVQSDVMSLFATGFFQDIEVSENPSGEGVAIVYKVTEKPSISTVEYKGNSALDDDELSELTKLKVFEIIDYAAITKGVSEIEKAYEDKGYYLAKVSYSVGEPTDQGVAVEFKIEENDQVLVKRVSFLGNEKLTDSELKSKMAVQEGGLFSGISGSGTFKVDAFERDVQLLNFLYFNKGYVDVKVSRPEVTVTPDKKGIYLSIRIEEGEQYDTGAVSFEGDMLFTDEELLEVATIDQSEIFVYEKVQSDLQALQAKYGDLGYAYANIIPRTFKREKDRKVDITYEFDKGEKVYFGVINVIGNSRTRDKVVRRELRISEGQLYNESKKRESVDNIQRLGYFENVTLNTKTPKGRDDLMDIDIVVKERNTGSFQLGAGYSSFSGPIFNAQLNQTNFLGKGWNVGLQVDYSEIQKRYKFSFTEPYFYDTLWSTGFDIYRNENRIPGLYEEKVEGAAFRLGHPIFGNRYLYGFLRYRLDETRIDLTPGQHPTDIFKEESTNGTTSSVTATAEYDRRNDRFAPTKGIHTSASFEYAGLGGRIQYNKGSAFFRWYRTLFWNVVLRTNFTYGYIAPNGDGDVPFNQLYRLGGPYNLRGYDFADIGQRQQSEIRRRYLEDELGRTPAQAARESLIVKGGRQQAYSMIELEFPLVKEAGIRGVTFYDVGTAEDDLVGNQFRSDVGFGVRWFSPIGPLRFEWGFPLNRRVELNDEASEFHFAIGAPF